MKRTTNWLQLISGFGTVVIVLLATPTANAQSGTRNGFYSPPQQPIHPPASSSTRQQFAPPLSADTQPTLSTGTAPPQSFFAPQRPILTPPFSNSQPLRFAPQCQTFMARPVLPQLQPQIQFRPAYPTRPVRVYYPPVTTYYFSPPVQVRTFRGVQSFSTPQYFPAAPSCQTFR